MIDEKDSQRCWRCSICPFPQPVLPWNLCFCIMSAGLHLKSRDYWNVQMIITWLRWWSQISRGMNKWVKPEEERRFWNMLMYGMVSLVLRKGVFIIYYDGGIYTEGIMALRLTYYLHGHWWLMCGTTLAVQAAASAGFLGAFLPLEGWLLGMLGWILYFRPRNIKRRIRGK